ncbi:MAG: hypothetical protein OXH70_18650 [Acidobacteria bacterium]|nr:hypothetical protein [Acidobacteriota bacterium]
MAEPVRERLLERSKRRRRKKQAKEIFNNLGREERAVVEAFVHSGGCAIDQDSYATRGFSRNGIESLASRGNLRHSTTAAGYREKYVLEQDLFDYARTVVDEFPF